MRILLLLIIGFVVHFTNAQSEVSLIVQSGHSGPVNDIVFSTDNKYLITCGEDNRIIVWDRKTRKQYAVLQGHTKAVNKLVVVPNQKDFVYSVGADGRFIKWHVQRGEILNSLTLGSSLGAVDYSESLNMFAIAGSGLSLISPEMDSVVVVDISQPAGSSFYSSATIEDVDFNKRGTAVVVTDGKGRVTNVSLSGGEAEIVTVKPISSVVYSENGKFVYTAGFGGGIARHRLGTFGMKRSPVMIKLRRNNALVRPTEKKLAVGNEKGEVMFLSTKSLWPKHKIITNCGEIKGLALNKDSTLIACVGITGDIEVYSVRNHKLLESYHSAVGRINDLDINNSGRLLAVGYNNGVVKVFDLKSFERIDLDAASIIGKTTDRRKILCRSIEWQGDSVHVIMLDTRFSNELQWMYDYIREYEFYWNPNTNNYSKIKRKEESEVANAYYAKEVDHINYGSPHLLDPSNLVIDASSKGVTTSMNNSVKINGGAGNHFYIKHSNRVTSLSAAQDLVVSGSWDGLIKLWDRKSGSHKLTLGLFEEDSFVLIDSANYYFSSKSGLDNIGFKYHNEVYSFEQFDLKFNRPDMVLSQLGHLHDQDAITSYNKAYSKRLERLDIKESDLELSENIPVARTTHMQDNPSELRLKMTAEANGAELSRWHIYVNGVPEFGKKGKHIENGWMSNEEHTVILSSGTNIIQAYVTAKNGLSSLKYEVVVTGDPKKETRTLYLVSIGASEFIDEDYNLNYAAKDARDIAAYFRENNPFDKIRVIEITNTDVTIERIEGLNEELRAAGPNDGLLLFAAGHGVLDEELDFYFSSHDMDFTNPSKRGIPYTMLEDVLDQCKSRYKCFLLDACHSGEFDKEEVEVAANTLQEEGEIKFRHVGTNIANHGTSSFELSKALFADMRPNTGTTVISSAGGAEYALEGGKWKNGVFTFAFLEGLSTGHADLNGDGEILLSEIHAYVANRVSALTNGKQTPTSRVENTYNDFKIK